MTDTPFKAGEGYRTRGGCAAGVDHTDGGEPYPLLGWIDYGEAGKRSTCWTLQGVWDAARAEHNNNLVLPPTPPADDLAAARAEIERLRSVLQDIAEERPYRKGYDQTDVDYEPAFTGTEAMNLARAALLPSPPDAKPAPERERLKGWLNVYPNEDCYSYPSKARADAAASPLRIACIDLSQHHVGEGLEP